MKEVDVCIILDRKHKYKGGREEISHGGIN